MNTCLMCPNEVAPDCSTCSEACNLAFRAGEEQKTDHQYDKAPEGITLYDASEIAGFLGLHKLTVYHWGQDKKIPSYRLGKRTMRFDLEAVRAAIDAKPHMRKWLKPILTPPNIEITPVEEVKVEIKAPSEKQFYRQRALAAAKQAFMDFVLEVADESKSRGDFKLQAELLEDFIFFEEGLKLIFEGRGKNETTTHR